MSEPMPTYVEVWPVAADQEGLWLISGLGPWLSRLPVQADDDPHADVERTLTGNGLDLADAPLIHSTSWRVDAPRLLLTYIAVVRRPGFVRDHWSAAKPISPRLPTALGKPARHAADQPPTEIREADVMFHTLRHLRLLWEFDSSCVAVLDDHWVRHLSTLRPALAGMYSEIEAMEQRVSL